MAAIDVNETFVELAFDLDSEDDLLLADLVHLPGNEEEGEDSEEDISGGEGDEGEYGPGGTPPPVDDTCILL